MNRSCRPLIYGVFLAVWACQLTAVFSSQPNFIVIFTDDQGYNDLGCFDSPNIKTPNIDRLATGGIRFTNYYSGASVCTPSRASLLTGCYPERVGNLPVLFPNSDRGLSLQENTIAELLRAKGYSTACIGKWHLGHHQKFLPTQHGFDEYFGIPYSNDMGIDATMQLSESVEFREGMTAEDFKEATNKLPPLMRDEKVIEWPADQTTLTQRYTQEALRFIDDNKDKPFFIYMPHTMPHIPLFASDEFRGKSDIGLYGDTIEEIDWSVGQIMQSLERLNLTENTFILYTSDNGPWNLPGNATDKVKGNMNRRIGGSATPLKGYKFSKWEGGMRVPAVMRFPALIKSDQVTDEIASSIDILPTIVELANATPPENKIDGKSLVGFLSGKEPRSPRDTFFYRTVGVRKENWKLVNGKLFDLSNDISEERDLKEDHPDKFAQLSNLLAEHKSEMRSEFRAPAYHQRDPFPLPGHTAWTVLAGRWNVNNKKVLRQQADYRVAQIRSKKLVALGEVDLECKQSTIDGSYGFDFSDGKSTVQVEIEASGDITVSSDRTSTLIATTMKNFDITKWHRIQMQFADDLLKVIVDGVYVGGLPAPVGDYEVGVRTNKVKCEFRAIRLLNETGEQISDSLSSSTHPKTE